MLASAQEIDCSASYGRKPAKCVPVSCSPAFQAFLGVWKGPLQAYSQQLSKNGKIVFRPYENTVTYDASDCLKNPELGETFIVGHMTDVYPPFLAFPPAPTTVC